MTVKELLLQEIETATKDQLAQTLTYIQTFKQNTLTTSDRSETIEDDLAGLNLKHPKIIPNKPKKNKNTKKNNKLQ